MNLSDLRDIAAITDPIERARALGAAMAEQRTLVAEAARMHRLAIAEARAHGHRPDVPPPRLGVHAARAPAAAARNGTTRDRPADDGPAYEIPAVDRPGCEVPAGGGPADEEAADGGPVLEVPAGGGPGCDEQGDGGPAGFVAADPAPAGTADGGAAGSGSGPSGRCGPQVIVYRSLPTIPTAHGAGCAPAGASGHDGARPELRFLGVGPEPASEHVATCLRIRPGDEVIARRRLVLADDVPVRTAGSYFRADLFRGTELAEHGLIRPSLQRVISALGHTFGHAEETLLARPANAAEADVLDLGPGEWVVQILRASYSPDDTPLHVLETVCAASRHVFTVSQVGGLDMF